MTIPTQSRNQFVHATGLEPPFDPMRMLADIDSRLTAIEQNLLTVLELLHMRDDEARRHGEKLARAISQVSR